MYMLNSEIYTDRRAPYFAVPFYAARDVNNMFSDGLLNSGDKEREMRKVGGKKWGRARARGHIY